VGGIFRHVRDLAEAQVAAGHKVGIVCDSSTGGAFEDKLFDAISGNFELGIYRTPMQRHIGLGDLTAAWRTFRIIKELQPNILHGHGAKGGVYARLFGSLLRVSGSRVARLYSPHGGSLHYDENTLTGKLFFGLERLMARFTDHLLFVSEYERRAYRRKVGEPPIPNTLVYNGLSLPEFAPVFTQPDAADFLYIGMMRDLKGADLFLDAIARMENRIGARISARMVGHGEHQKYRAQVAALGLSDRVVFHDTMPAREAFGLGRVIVVPSRAEAMPYIVLEALAAGKTMVATAVGGIPEIFGADSGMLVRADADALAGQMTRAYLEPEAFAALMPTAETLRARFGADVMAASIEKAYGEALSR